MADLSITAANVVPGTTVTPVKETGVAGATITAGQVVYKDSSDSNKFKLADNNSATAAAKTPYGVALHGASAGQPLTVQLRGSLAMGSILTSGTVYCLSATAGGICPVADLASGNTASVIGVATSTSNLEILIFSPGATI